MAAKTTKSKKMNRTKWNLILDIALAAVFMVEMEEHFTGLPMHEVLGLIFGVALVLHIILHWNWIVSLTRTFGRKVLHESRLNYVLNAALFVDLLVVTVTGVVISRTLGFHLEVPRSWQTIHIVASELSLVLIALHVAMHWKWILTNVRKYILARLTLTRPASAAPAVNTRKEVSRGTAQ